MTIKIGTKTHSATTFTPVMIMEVERILKEIQTNKASDTEVIEMVAPFLATTVFRGAFTSDDFIEQFASPTVVMDILKMLSHIRGLISETVAQFPTATNEIDEAPKKNTKVKKVQ